MKFLFILKHFALSFCFGKSTVKTLSKLTWMSVPLFLVL